jgi:hypothetical protein
MRSAIVLISHDRRLLERISRTTIWLDYGITRTLKTNDLDLETLDLLQEQLAEYPGTVLLVSHDRDFLDRVVTSVIATEGNGRWIEYAGGYTDMLAQREPAGRRTPPAKASIAKRPRPVTEVRAQPAALRSINVERKGTGPKNPSCLQYEKVLHLGFRVRHPAEVYRARMPRATRFERGHPHPTLPLQGGGLYFVVHVRTVARHYTSVGGRILASRWRPKGVVTGLFELTRLLFICD